MLLPARVDDNVVTCHSAEHPYGASALRGLHALVVAVSRAEERAGNSHAMFCGSWAGLLPRDLVGF